MLKLVFVNLCLGQGFSRLHEAVDRPVEQLNSEDFVDQTVLFQQCQFQPITQFVGLHQPRLRCDVVVDNCQDRHHLVDVGYLVEFADLQREKNGYEFGSEGELDLWHFLDEFSDQRKDEEDFLGVIVGFVFM